MNRRYFIAGTLTLTALGLGPYIVIHHSAGEHGNIEFLKQVHRERQANDPIDAIPYH